MGKINKRLTEAMEIDSELSSLRESLTETINMGEKITLTALQLVYLLDDAMETLCLRAEDGQEVDTMVIAKEKVLEFF